MAKQIPPAELVNFLNAHPDRYKNEPLGDGYNSTRSICHQLTKRPRVANPEPAPKVPKPMDPQALYNALTSAEIQAIGIEGFGLIHDAIDAGDRLRVKRLVNIAYRKGWIDEDKHNAIVGHVDAEVDDPDHPAEVLDRSDVGKQWGGLAGGGKNLRQLVDETLGR